MSPKERADAVGRTTRGSGERFRRDGPGARRVPRRPRGATRRGGGLCAPGDRRWHRQPPPEVHFGEPRFGLRGPRGRARVPWVAHGRNSALATSIVSLCQPPKGIAVEPRTTCSTFLDATEVNGRLRFSVL